MGEGVAVFFDIGGTLANPVIAGEILIRLEVYPFVLDVLARLRVAGGDDVPVALGLISNTGSTTAARMDHLLVDAGLLSLIDRDLCLFSSVEGLDKSQPALFERARGRAALPAARCVFVGEDAAERAVAASMGFRTSPHPLHVLYLVETEQASPSLA